MHPTSSTCSMWRTRVGSRVVALGEPPPTSDVVPQALPPHAKRDRRPHYTITPGPHRFWMGTKRDGTRGDCPRGISAPTSTDDLSYCGGHAELCCQCASPALVRSGDCAGRYFTPLKVGSWHHNRNITQAPATYAAAAAAAAPPQRPRAPAKFVLLPPLLSLPRPLDGWPGNQCEWGLGG